MGLYDLFSGMLIHLISYAELRVMVAQVMVELFLVLISLDFAFFGFVFLVLVNMVVFLFLFVQALFLWSVPFL